MIQMISSPMMSEAAFAPQPVVKLPSGAVLRTLTVADQMLLRKLVCREPEYIDHPQFADPGIESRLFGGDADRIGMSALPFRWPSVTRSTLTPDGVPTLSRMEEQHLFMRFNYARREVAEALTAAKGRCLTAAEARRILLWEHRANAVRALLVQMNLRLVLKMIKCVKLNEEDMNELISDGNVALLRCVECFDCARGFRFSTYSCNAIRRSLFHVARRGSRYRRRFPVEFNADMERSDYVSVQRSGVECDCVDELKDILARNLGGLSEIERRVIQERFAIATPVQPPAPKTLAGVGQLLGVTKERVRQIQNSAFTKIRETLDARYLGGGTLPGPSAEPRSAVA